MTLAFSNQEQGHPTTGTVTAVNTATLDVQVGATLLRNVAVAAPLEMESVIPGDTVALTWHGERAYATSVLNREGTARQYVPGTIINYINRGSGGGGGGGGVDHGALAGLGDDDHPQYTALAQDEMITGSWTYQQTITGNISGNAGTLDWYDAVDFLAPQYLVLSADSNLSAERVLTAGDGLDLTDAGAGSTATLDVDVTDFLGNGTAETDNNIYVYSLRQSDDGDAALTADAAGDMTAYGSLDFNAAESITTSAGNLTIAPAGDVVFDPVGNDILPETAYDLNIGAISKKYLTLHVAELWVETLVAQDTIATIGGRILVGPTTKLTRDFDNDDLTIYVEHNEMASGDIAYLEAMGKVEFITITSAATPSSSLLSNTGFETGDTPAWTPASATTDGSQLPEHWYRADSGTWQDSVGNTVADGDGEVVGAWEDKAAAGDDVTQGTAANKPTLQTNELNGESVLRFDGNDWLSGAFTSGGSMSQPNTLFVVAKLDAGAVNDNAAHTMIDGDDADRRMKIFQNAEDTPDSWSLYAGGADDVDGGASDSSWNIWTVVYNGSSSEAWLNGVSEITGNPGTDAVDGLSVGRRYDGSDYWEGDIAEIILYEANLSDADKNEVGGYLGDRYNISYTDIT